MDKTREEARAYLAQKLSNNAVNIEHILDDLDDYDLATLDRVVSDIHRGLPVQYATKTAYFYGRRFVVDERVLIPRPETEELVREVVRTARNRSDVLSIIDIGTGSGVIPISLKYELPEARVEAVDYSREALEVASANAIKHNQEIQVHQLDFLDPEARSVLSMYDIIVSNPPYIPHQEKVFMGEDVIAYEPHMALFVEDDSPLVFYEALATFGESHLQPAGYIFCEINEYLGEETKRVFLDQGYKDVEIVKDMQGKDRICRCRKST